MRVYLANIEPRIDLVRVAPQEIEDLAPFRGIPVAYCPDPLGIVRVQVWPEPGPGWVVDIED